MEPLSVLTIGHSNRDLHDFLRLLSRHGVGMVVDVRAHPGSRKLPHFGRDTLPASLRDHAVEYEHVSGLGGRRRLQPDASSELADGWRNSSFRAYGQYVQTNEYATSLNELLDLAATRRTAIMCAEAVPWRCHRWLISDTLVARDIDVMHVIDEDDVRLHKLTPFAQVTDGKIRWPGPPSEQKLKLGPRVQLSGF